PRGRAPRGGRRPADPTRPHRSGGQRRADGRSCTRHFSSWLPRWYAFRVWRRRDGAELPVIIGHRGASNVETENTVPAFARARAHGADGVELDVMTCGTGEVVVFHDDDLGRLAHRPERIADTPFAVLRQVVLAPGATIPTLDEVFEACG